MLEFEQQLPFGVSQGDMILITEHGLDTMDVDFCRLGCQPSGPFPQLGGLR